jgi:hypothetical protein
VPCSPTIASFCMFLFMRQDAKKASEFFQGLRTGANLNETSPVFVFRRGLINGRLRGLEMRRREELALWFKAWNAYRDGRSIKGLFFREDEAFPTIGPVPGVLQ